MRRLLLICIGLDEKEYAPIGELLKSIGEKDLSSMFNRRFGFIEVYEDQTKALQLLDGLDSLNIPSLSWDISRIENHYTEKELLSFPLLHIMAESFININKNKEKSIYDYSNACSVCGNGRTQIGDLVIKDVDKINRLHFSKTHDFEYLASRSLGEVIKDSRFSGISFRDVRSSINKNVAFQLIPTNILPPMDPNILTFDSSSVCKQCKGRFLKIKGNRIGENEPKYTSSKIDFKDFNYTFESFGIGQNAHREILISSEVLKAFLEFKVKKISLNPVHILNEEGKKITPKLIPKPSKVDIMRYKSHWGFCR